MNIKTYDKTIKDLLISGRQFVIPRFQREYSWDKKNYEEFYRDIVENLEVVNNEIKDSSYFLGTMLFIGSFTDACNNEIQVVDGQQRITTITIFLSVLSQIFKEKEQEKLSEAVFRYIMTKDDNGEPVRILKTKTSFPFFSFFIQSHEKEVDELLAPISEEELCIKETYDYFKSQLEEKTLRKFLSKKIDEKLVKNTNYLNILKAIRDQILNCTFVNISTSDKEQANRIFENLNAKGKRLGHIDLIKNRVFEILNKVEPADYAEILWSKITLHCNNVNIGIGTFYRHFWVSTYKRSSNNRLYDDFVNKIPAKEDVYKKFLLSMKENVLLYEKILKPTRENHKNKKQYYWLVESLRVLSDDFNITQVRVPLMAILWAKDKKIINMKILKNTVQYLENFHFAYTALMSGKANRLDSTYSTFAIKLRSCSKVEDAKHIIDELLIDKLEKLFPKFDSFKDKFIKLSFSKHNNPSNIKCRYALRKLYCSFTDKDLCEPSASVEHIVPENTEGDVLNIGNLILLEENINNEAGTKSYADKIELYKNSEYKWVKDFVREHKTWELKDVPARAEKLAEIYYSKIFNRNIIKM